MTHQPTIGLCYFSGTGNTKIVTELLAEAFEKHGANVTIIRMEHVTQGKIMFDPQAYDITGIAHPVHGFGAPRVVDEFVDLLPPAEDQKAFFLKTAGDFLAINNGASKPLIRRLKRKGYRVFYDRIICMPSNWALAYNDEFSKQLCYAAIGKTEHMAQDILAGTERRLPFHPILTWLIQWVTRGEALGGRVFGRFLKVTNACTDCGKCINNCPTQNIRRENGRITFGYECVFCMKCIYACPEQAIVPRAFKFSVLKDGYDVQRIINDPNIEGDYITAETKGFFKRFYDYLQNPEI